MNPVALAEPDRDVDTAEPSASAPTEAALRWRIRRSALVVALLPSHARRAAFDSVRRAYHEPGVRSMYDESDALQRLNQYRLGNGDLVGRIVEIRVASRARCIRAAPIACAVTCWAGVLAVICVVAAIAVDSAALAGLWIGVVVACAGAAIGVVRPRIRRDWSLIFIENVFRFIHDVDVRDAGLGSLDDRNALISQVDKISLLRYRLYLGIRPVSVRRRATERIALQCQAIRDNQVGIAQPSAATRAELLAFFGDLLRFAGDNEWWRLPETSTHSGVDEKWFRARWLIRLAVATGALVVALLLWLFGAAHSWPGFAATAVLAIAGLATSAASNAISAGDTMDRLISFVSGRRG